MRSRSLIIALALAIVVTATVGCWVMLLRTVPVLPGMRGCSTLAARDDRVACVSGRFQTAVESEGVPAALRSLEEVARSSPKIEEACHQAGHVSAPRIFEPDAVKHRLYDAASVRGDCAEGLFHGMMIVAMDGRGSASRDALAEVCASDRMQAVELRTSCVHAIGHGLGAKSALSPALTACEGYYRPGNDLAGHCYSGVFMQYGMDRVEQMRRSGDIAGHCRAYDGELAWLCYSYVPSNGVALGWSSERVLGTCQRSPQASSARAACLGGVGNGRLQDGSGLCMKLDDAADISACMRGFFIRNSVNFTLLDERQSAAICRDAETPTAGAACARALGSAWRTELWPKPGIETCRARFSDKLERACLAGRRDDPTSAVAAGHA